MMFHYAYHQSPASSPQSLVLTKRQVTGDKRLQPEVAS